MLQGKGMEIQEGPAEEVGIADANVGASKTVSV